MASESQIYIFLEGVFKNVFGREDIRLQPSLTANDVVGWDSFRHVEIILALEDEYAIRIRTREVNEISTLGELVSLVLRKQASSE